MLSRPRLAAIAGSVALLAGTGTAVAAFTGSTEITVEPKTTVQAGEIAPFDAPGVRSIRRGKPIPSGYVLVGQTVVVKRGKNVAGAALSFTCPGTKRLKTFGTTGSAGFLAPRSYVDHRRTQVISFPNPKLAQSSGTVYAVCR